MKYQVIYRRTLLYELEAESLDEAVSRAEDELDALARPLPHPAWEVEEETEIEVGLAPSDRQSGSSN